MIDGVDVSRLAARGRDARAALRAGLAATAFAAVLLVLLMDPGPGGVVDVHVPAAGRDFLAAHAALLAKGEPWVVGRGAGRWQQGLAFVLHAGSMLAALVALWALAGRRKTAGILAVAYIVSMNVAGPIPVAMQAEPPVAIGAASADRLLRAAPPDGSAWRRYALAQVAYLRGDAAGAAALARGVGWDDLHSPIEARYRLQFLRGEPVAVTTTCFEFGCLSPERRRDGRAMAAALLVAGVAAASGAAVLLVTLRRRARRIDALRGGRPCRRSVA